MKRKKISKTQTLTDTGRASQTPNLECRMYEAKYPKVDMAVMIWWRTSPTWAPTSHSSSTTTSRAWSCSPSSRDVRFGASAVSSRWVGLSPWWCSVSTKRRATSTLARGESPKKISKLARKRYNKRELDSSVFFFFFFNISFFFNFLLIPKFIY